MKRSPRVASHKSRRVFVGGVLAVALLGGAAALWLKDKAGGNVFAALQNSASRPLAAGGVHVDDLAADLFGYTGTVTLRAVVAKVNSNASPQYVVIDSREAKICKSTGCAKFYLPVISDNQPIPHRWDEVDLRGKVVQGQRYPYFAAESVTNLGSIE